MLPRGPGAGPVCLARASTAAVDSNMAARATAAIRCDRRILFILKPESRTFAREVVNVQITGGYVRQIHYSGGVYDQGDLDCFAYLFFRCANLQCFLYMSIDTSLTFGDERSSYGDQFLGLGVQVLGFRVIDLPVELAVDPPHLGLEH